MIKRYILFFMACHLLACSFVLPLGDFSLIRDIPNMFDRYSKITTAEEFGVIDFIGDYLLNGKDILGHNKRDKHPNPANDVQFRHEANAVSIVFTRSRFLFSEMPILTNDYWFLNQQFSALSHPGSIFRPPIA